MRKLSTTTIIICVVIVVIGVVCAMIQANILEQSIVFRALWIISACALAVYGFILLYEGAEYFLGADLLEGLKKFLWGISLIILLVYPMAATMVPAIQVFVTWDKPAFLEKVLVEAVPQGKDTLEISPPAQEEEIVEEKPKSRIPGMN